ncbi:MAG: hypothetical protein ACLFM0_06790 [Spirochaetales bacterium]
MKKMRIESICNRALIVILLLVGFGLHAQTIGVRPGIAFYTGTAGFEGLLEGRFDLPFFEDGPGQFTTSAFLGYSYVDAGGLSTNGFMLGAGGGYEVNPGPEEVYTTPGLITGVEFSQFNESVLENEAAIMLVPYIEAGYEFDFNLSAGLQLGLKNLFYVGEYGAAERSITLGPVVHYTFGG